MDNNNALHLRNKNVSLCLQKDEDTNPKSYLRHEYKPYCERHGIRSVNMTGNNRYLIITFTSHFGYIRVIDLEKLELMPCQYTGHRNSVRMVAVSKNNKSFMTASWDGTYRRFDLLKGTNDKTLGVTGRSPTICYDKDETHILSASYDSEISLSKNNTGRRWNLATNEIVTYYRHYKPRKEPECIDIACDNQYVYSGSDDGMGLKFKMHTGEIILKFFDCEANIRKIAVSDHFFAASGTDGLIRVHDKTTGNIVRTFFHSNTDAMDIRISKDEKKIWSGSMDGTIKCFNIVSGEELYHIKIHDHWIWSLYLSGDNSLLVSGSSDGTVAFISADTGSLLARLECFPAENEFIFECPPDKAFPNGFFYTTNKEFIEVVLDDPENGKKEILGQKDEKRISYIDRLNLKNMVITRLTNNRQYTAITEKYLSDSKLLHQIPNLNLPKRLRS